jgi:hypothetical protein
VPRSQAIGRAVEVLGKPLDQANVTLRGSFRVMTARRMIGDLLRTRPEGQQIFSTALLSVSAASTPCNA